MLHLVVRRVDRQLIAGRERARVVYSRYGCLCRGGHLLVSASTGRKEASQEWLLIAVYGGYGFLDDIDESVGGIRNEKPCARRVAVFRFCGFHGVHEPEQRFSHLVAQAEHLDHYLKPTILFINAGSESVFNNPSAAKISDSSTGVAAALCSVAGSDNICRAKYAAG